MKGQGLSCLDRQLPVQCVIISATQKGGDLLAVSAAGVANVGGGDGAAA